MNHENQENNTSAFVSNVLYFCTQGEHILHPMDQQPEIGYE